MVKMLNKIILVIMTSLTLLCNFNVVFADEEESLENLELNLTENTDSQTNEQQTIEHTTIINNIIDDERLNNIENSINDINDLLDDFSPMLLSVSSSASRGKKSNFDNLNVPILQKYYEVCNRLDCAYFIIIDDVTQYIYNWIIDETFDDHVHSSLLNTIYFNRDDTFSNVDFDLYLVDSDHDFGWVKYKDFTNEYYLQPFKLNIVNYGLGEISNSVNIEPYVSTNIYYNNQSISLTYDNEYDDFNGWFINGIKVSDNLSYTFNITTDTTICLNYYDTDIDDSNTVNLLYCIFIMILFLTFKNLIWGV